MKIACFDCPSGAAGDMILASLVDSGLPVERLQEALHSLSLPPFKIEVTRQKRSGIVGTGIRFVVPEEKKARHLKDITALIDNSSLPSRVKEDSKRVFQLIGEAEAKVHGVDVEAIHFHEVGAMDSILDIVGVSAALHIMDISEVYCTVPSTGSGEVRAAHGTMPVPSPATVEILMGRPIRKRDVQGELLTPTGAALLVGFTRSFGPHPPMLLEGVGYGAGTAEFDSLPNLVRVMIGNRQENGTSLERVSLLETDIDHLPSELLGGFFEKALAEGALDVTLIATVMKKNRPGHRLSLLCRPADATRLAELIISETGSLGVRISEVDRLAVERVEQIRSTRFGKVRFKKSTLPGGRIRLAPEYDDCLAIARREGLPLREVWEEVSRTNEEDAI